MKDKWSKWTFVIEIIIAVLLLILVLKEFEVV